MCPITKIPYLIAILGMVGGIFIAIMFGVNEDLFQEKIANDLQNNTKIVAMENPEARADKIKSESAKLWRYYQRFHFHSTGIGAMSLSLLIFLSFISAPMKLKLVTSYLVGFGGFLYPFVWLFAGLFGGTMGRHEAKEAFAIFGYCGGLFLVGAIFVLLLAVKYPIDHTKQTSGC